MNFLEFENGFWGWATDAADRLLWVKFFESLPLDFRILQTPTKRQREFSQSLARFLRGEPVAWNVEIAWSGTPFQLQVWRTLTKQVPWGKLITYGELAALSGFPRAARAVGNAMRLNPWAIVIPCHRVVGENNLGGYFGRLDLKRRLLELEGHNLNDLIEKLQLCY
jgi:O-6-methylguanine DNA methyltransferase